MEASLGSTVSERKTLSPSAGGSGPEGPGISRAVYGALHGSTIGVGVAVGDGVEVGVWVDVGSGVGRGVAVAVDDGARGVDVGPDCGVGIGVEVEVGVAVAVKVGVGVGVDTGDVVGPAGVQATARARSVAVPVVRKRRFMFA